MSSPFYSIIYDSALVTNPFIEELKSLYRYRDLVKQLAERNIKTRYKRSVLGVLWTLMTPVVMTFLFTLVFSRLFTSSIPYFPIYAMSGYILWTFFVQTSSSAMSEIVWGGTLLNRIYVPPSVFVASALISSLTYLGLALIVLLSLKLVLGHTFHWALLFLPISLLIVASFSLGIGLFLATYAVRFHDTLEMWAILTQGLFFLTPIFYPVTAIPPERLFLIRFNPIYYILETFRYPLYNGSLAPASMILIATIISISTLGIGWYVFSRKAEKFPYFS